MPAPSRLFRISFVPDVAQVPDWRWQQGEQRWDDPRIAVLRRILADSVGQDIVGDVFGRVMNERGDESEIYRVLYAADSRSAAYVEALQSFRRTSTASARGLWHKMTRVEKGAQVPIFDAPAIGVVPASSLISRYVGEIELEDAGFVDLDAIETVQYIRSGLLGEARRLGLSDVNRGTILGGHREFTQLVSKFLYEHGDRFAGVTHGSTLGSPHQNYCIFDVGGSGITRSRVQTIASARIELDDADLLKAIEYLRVEIEGVHRGFSPMVSRQDIREPELAL